MLTVAPPTAFPSHRSVLPPRQSVKAHATPPELSLGVLRRCDRAVLRFEQALEAGAEPRVGEHLGDAYGLYRDYLAGELLHAELHHLREGVCDGVCDGDAFDPLAWRDRHLAAMPDDAAAVRRVWQECFSDADADAAAGPGELEGSEVGPYRLRRLLGVGGMGRVYAAHDTRLDREVAVKLMAWEYCHDPTWTARFRQEGQAVAALQHPNVVAVHDIGSWQGTSYLVTELLHGETLRQRLARGPLTVAETVELGRGVAVGLAAAHAGGVVHRDLKPENLFLTGDGQVKILDFGLARRVDRDPPRRAAADAAVVASSDAAETETGAGFAGANVATPVTVRTDSGVVLGTQGYMSPEQVRGEPVEAASDLFALGCVLHEALTATSPFRRDSPAETMSAILRDPPRPSLRQRTRGRERFPAALVALIGHCLRKEREERPADAAAVAERLGQSAAARAATWWSGAAARTAAAVLLLATLVGGALWATGATGDAAATSSTPPATDAAVAAAAEPQPAALRVMPFEAVGADDADRSLSVGLPLGVSNALGRTEGLAVRPFDLSADDGTADDLPEAGADSRAADLVLSGTVAADAAGPLAVRLQLVDRPTDTVVAATELRGPSSDLARLRRQAAAFVADHFGLEAPPEPPAAPDPAAYQRYLRGWLAWKQRTPESLRRAAEHLEAALETDPESIDALTTLAYCHVARVESGDADPKEACPSARRLALRALTLDRRAADAHVVLGRVAFEFERDFASAASSFREALRQAPRHPTARQWHAEFLSATGDHDAALAEIDRAAEREPHSPVVPTVRGRLLFQARRFADAERQLLEVVAAAPQSQRARQHLVDLYEHQDRLADALDQWDHLESPYLAGQFRLGVEGGDAPAYWRLRQEAGFVRRNNPADERVRRPVTPVQAAVLHLKMDEPGAALSQLRWAAERRDGAFAAEVLVHPGLDRLRGDPRFHALLVACDLRAFADAELADQAGADANLPTLVVLPFAAPDGDPDLARRAVAVAHALHRRLAASAAVHALPFDRGGATSWEPARDPIPADHVLQGVVLPYADDGARFRFQMIGTADRRLFEGGGYDRSRSVAWEFGPIAAQAIAGHMHWELPEWAARDVEADRNEQAPLEAPEHLIDLAGQVVAAAWDRGSGAELPLARGYLEEALSYAPDDAATQDALLSLETMAVVLGFGAPAGRLEAMRRLLDQTPPRPDRPRRLFADAVLDLYLRGRPDTAEAALTALTLAEASADGQGPGTGVRSLALLVRADRHAAAGDAAAALADVERSTALATSRPADADDMAGTVAGSLMHDLRRAELLTFLGRAADAERLLSDHWRTGRDRRAADALALLYARTARPAAAAACLAGDVPAKPAPTADGSPDAWRRCLAALAVRRDASADLRSALDPDLAAALVHTALASPDAAFAALSAAASQRSPSLWRGLNLDPALAPLRGDSRFADLRGRLAIPGPAAD